MKRLLAFLSLAIVLSACGGRGSKDAIVCTEQYWNGSIALCLPAGWVVLERERLTERGIPEQVVVAFQSETSVSGQTPTLTVTSERLPTAMDTPTYSRASIRSVTTLPGYKLLDSRSVEIEGQDAEIHAFTAQPIQGEPERRFTQLSAASGSSGYTFTALTPVSVGDKLEKEILLILNSVRFSEPK